MIELRVTDSIRNPQSSIRNSGCYISPAGAHAVVTVADFDADGVPAAVFLPAGRIADVVLLAQLVGDIGSGWVEIARVAHDFRSATAVVGHVAQRGDVDPIVAADRRSRPSATAASAPAADRRRRPAGTPAAAGERKGHRGREPRRRLPLHCRLALTVDADGVDQHLALENLRLHLADAAGARRIVAVRDE